MKSFATLFILAAATLGAAQIQKRLGFDCGNNYGWEACDDAEPGGTRSHVIVCNDQHVWALRENCGHGPYDPRFCCQDKPGGGAYCNC
ncbi:hypothetical protein NLG97_g6610 [Lecanicillium saksenae]|uniref:Uncharacterized protein n=1 Tax=Lecanicillium saksenae TaxID=468837 RepID=A0ACC1QSZ1_9HYPO|nr:hypothetical protein NLG97_g6610 [Lecanicillium saksenae]